MAENRIEVILQAVNDLPESLRESADAMDDFDDSVQEANGAIEGLGEDGADSVKKFDKEVKQTNKSVSDFGSKLKKAFSVAAVVLATKKILELGKASVAAADVQLKAEAQLLNATKGNEDAQKRLIDIAQERQRLTSGLFGDEETIKAQAFAASLGLTIDQIEKLTPLAQDYAAKSGRDLSSTFELLARTSNTSTNALSRYGIEVEGAAGSTERFDQLVSQLDKQVGGLAIALGNVGNSQAVRLRASLGDLSEEIGKKLLPSFNAVNGELAGFTEGVIDYIATPLSSTLEEERINLNVLVDSLIDAGDNQEKRNAAIATLQQNYPSFLENINIETATTADLRDRLSEVNKEYVNRIVVEKQQENITKRVQKLANSNIKQAEKEVELRRQLFKINEELATPLVFENETLKEKAALLKAQISTDNASNINGFRRAEILNTINGLETRSAALLAKSGKRQEQLNEAELERNQILEALGINLEDYTKKTNTATTGNSNFTNSVKAQEQAILDLQELIVQIDPSEFLPDENIDEDIIQRNIDLLDALTDVYADAGDDFTIFDDETVTLPDINSAEIAADFNEAAEFLGKTFRERFAESVKKGDNPISSLLQGFGVGAEESKLISDSLTFVKNTVFTTLENINNGALERNRSFIDGLKSNITELSDDLAIQQQLAAAGLANNTQQVAADLDIQIKLKKKALEKQKELELRAARQKRALAIFNIAASQAQAIASAIAGATAAGAATGLAAPITTPLFIAQLVGIAVAGLAQAIGALKPIPSFYGGTEGTVGQALGRKAGRDSHVVRVDNDEMILNPGITKSLQGVGASELPRLVKLGKAFQEMNGILVQSGVQPMQDDRLFKEVKKIANKRDLGEKTFYGEGFYETKQGNRTTRVSDN